jgi:organic radical activating enzyme
VSESATVRSRDAVLAVSEIFESLQGEGPSTGEPSQFLRLARCNLHCRYCDTRYTWDFSEYRVEDEVHEMSVEKVAERLRASALRRLVVTGGEPLLQQRALARLFGLIFSETYVEVETNGTVAPEAALADRVDQWNVSPKLSNGGDPESLRIRPAVLAALLATGHAYLKLVVRSAEDVAEAEALVAGTGWPRDRVLFMPEAATPAELSERSGFVAAEALRRGVRYSTRLHVEIWGGVRGR